MDEIKELIYRRPEMFIGAVWRGDTWDGDAIHALIKIVVEHMVDPATGNHPSSINILLQSERKIVLEDNGSGLPLTPLARFPNSSTPALVDLLSWYMPTGIPSREQYKEFGFLSYFAKLLNVLSEQLQIDTVRDGIVYTISCSRGEIVKSLAKTDSSILEYGTRITFEPDSEYFSDFSFNLQKLETGINSLKLQHNDIVFNLSDRRKQ